MDQLYQVAVLSSSRCIMRCLLGCQYTISTNIYREILTVTGAYIIAIFSVNPWLEEQIA